MRIHATTLTAVLACSFSLGCGAADDGDGTQFGKKPVQGSGANPAAGKGGAGSSASAASGAGGNASGSSAGSGGRAGSSGSSGGGTSGAGRAGSSGNGGGGSGASASGGMGGAVASADAGTMMMDAGTMMMPEPGERSLSTDRDTFFGDSRCGAAGVKLCEDFEAGSAGQAPDAKRWSVFGAAPSIDDARAARGKHSLHVHTDGNGVSLIQEVASFPATGNAFYGRMFVWFDSLPTAPQWAHWTIVAATGSGDTSEIRVGGQWDGSKNRWGVGTDHGPTGDWTNLDDDPHNAAVPPPTKQWVCVEWLYDGGNNEMRFFMDGTEHPSLHVTETDHGGDDVPFKLPTFDKLGLGWWLYQANPTPDHYDVWIDEIALDDQRIGCVL